MTETLATVSKQTLKPTAASVVLSSSTRSTTLPKPSSASPSTLSQKTVATTLPSSSSPVHTKYTSNVTYEASTPEADAKLKSFGSYQDYKEWVDNSLKPYRNEDGTINPVGALAQYGRSGMLEFGFSGEDIDKAQHVLDLETRLKPFTDASGMVDLVAALDSAVTVDDLKELGYDEKTVGEASWMSSAMSYLKSSGAMTGSGQIDLIRLAGINTGQSADIMNGLKNRGYISNIDVIKARTLSRYRVGDSGTFDFMQAVTDVNAGKVTAGDVETAFGVHWESMENWLILDRLYKTPDGYNLAQALADHALPHRLRPEDFGGVLAVDKARQQGALLSRLGDRSIEEAISAGVVTPEELVRLGAFTTEAEAKRYTTQVQALSKIQGTKYQVAEGAYDLDAIQYDEVLTPQELMLVFGETEEGRVALKQSLERVAPVKAKAVKMESASASYKRASKAADIARVYLDWTVPVYGTQRHWKRMSTTWRAVSVVGDVLAIIPIVGAVGKGARGVTIAVKGGRSAATLARLKGATKGMAGEAINQMAWAPRTLEAVGSLAKPVTVTTDAGRISTITGIRAVGKNAKTLGQLSVGRAKAAISPLETVLSRAKLPESVVTTADGTLRIPLSLFASPQEAMRARDMLVKAAMEGKSPVIHANGRIIEFRQNALMKELGGGAAHATPQGEKFTSGLMVSWKDGKPLAEQGLFVSPEPLERFATASAFGQKGDMTTMYIMSPSLAKDTVATGKIYRGAVELERKLPLGYKLPKPAQVLYTRMGDTGERVVIMLDKKLTAKQIWKLKALGLTESVGNIVSPRLLIKGGKPLTASEAQAVIQTLERSGQRQPARLLRGISDDPQAAARFARSYTTPSIVRVDLEGRASGINVSMTEVRPRQGESTRQYIDRATTIMRTPPGTRDRIARAYDAGLARDRYDKDQRDRVATATVRTVTPRVATVDRVPRLDRMVRTEGMRIRSTTKTPPLRPKLKGKAKPVVPPIPSSTQAQDMDIPASAAGWRQGAVYWHIWPDGDQLVTRATRQPVEGISYKAGVGSAYDSLRKLHKGRLPKLMAMDMGIMDVYVQGDSRGDRPKMRVRQDLHQRSRLGYVEGNPSMSRMK